ncbi:hypothetical protein B7494_g4921 [Chlorociboria aeruginascens]|nr:hypothetical protein B7494_g4921 [Chlorociboria aeruginascens]
MNTVKSFWVGWGSLCVAGGAAYYFAKQSINADRAARYEVEQRRRRMTESLEHSGKTASSSNTNSSAKKGNGYSGPPRSDSSGSPSQEATSDPAPTRHAPDSEGQRVREPSKVIDAKSSTIFSGNAKIFVLMASHQLAIAKASFSAGLLRPDPTSITREEIAHFHSILNAAVVQCSPRNVQTCKHWILENIIQSTARSTSLGKYLVALTTSFVPPQPSPASPLVKKEPSVKRKRIHILYIINDILHHAKYRSKDASVSSKLQPILESLFGSASSFKGHPRHYAKILDLLEIWQDKNYYSKEYIAKLREVSKNASELGGYSDADSRTSDKLHQDPTAKTTKSVSYIMPANHGDGSTPWFDLPAGNLMPHIVPNSARPINPDMIKPLQLRAGPADENLVQAVKSLLDDVSIIFGSETYQNEKTSWDIDELGQQIVLDEITGDIIEGEGYYGWSRNFCEKMKKRRQESDHANPSGSRSSRDKAMRRHSNESSLSLSDHKESIRRQRSYSGSRSPPPDPRRHTYSRSLSRSRSRSRSPGPPQSAPFDYENNRNESQLKPPSSSLINSAHVLFQQRFSQNLPNPSQPQQPFNGSGTSYGTWQVPAPPMPPVALNPSFNAQWAPPPPPPNAQQNPGGYSNNGWPQIQPGNGRGYSNTGWNNPQSGGPVYSPQLTHADASLPTLVGPISRSNVTADRTEQEVFCTLIFSLLRAFDWLPSLLALPARHSLTSVCLHKTLARSTRQSRRFGYWYHIMNAQISFIEGQFSLIHIPLRLYSALLQPILRVLLPHGGPSNLGRPEDLLEGLSIDNKHGFLNISVTPIECSVVCHTTWAQNVFEPVVNRLSREVSKQVQISKDSYIVFSVNSAGMEAGQRVMDLTAPLAMAGIPIFFITTYYTDFILVPSKDRHTVGQALLARGFEFSENDSAYVAPTAISHSRGPSAAGSDPPSTPPPSNVAELQLRTFNQLKKRNVIPFIEPGLHLVQCSGKKLSENGYSRPNSNVNTSNGSDCPSWLENIDAKLYVGLVSALIQQPRFLSVTLAQDDAPSLLVDKSLLWLFGNSVAGDTEGDLVPIFLDLVDLPLESTGIVCGVAGKLADEMRINELEVSHGAELSYLSTARAGAVILSSEGSARALEALQPLLEREQSS